MQRFKIANIIGKRKKSFDIGNMMLEKIAGAEMEQQKYGKECNKADTEKRRADLAE